MKGLDDPQPVFPEVASADAQVDADLLLSLESQRLFSALTVLFDRDPEHYAYLRVVFEIMSPHLEWRARARKAYWVQLRHNVGNQAEFRWHFIKTKDLQVPQVITVCGLSERSGGYTLFDPDESEPPLERVCSSCRVFAAYRERKEP